MVFILDAKHFKYFNIEQKKKLQCEEIAYETLFLTIFSIKQSWMKIKKEYAKLTTNISTLMFQSSVEPFYTHELIEGL